MALADATFAHFHDSLDADYPTSGLTRSNPGSMGDPSISSGTGTYDDTSPGDALSFALSTGTFFSGGTGDFTMAWRGTISTAKSNSNCMMCMGLGGAFDRNITLRQASSVGMSLEIEDTTSAGTDAGSGNNVFTLDTPFTVVARRSSSVVTIWVDGVDESNTDDFGARNLNGDYDDVFIGAQSDEDHQLDGTCEFAVFWDEALSDSDIQNNIDETTLKNAILGSATVIVPIKTHGKHHKYRQLKAI